MGEKTWKEDMLERITRLEERFIGLESHFTNHLHRHVWDRILSVIYFALVVIMFAYLKWGK